MAHMSKFAKRRELTDDIGGDLRESSECVLSVLDQGAAVLLQVINVSGEFSLQGIVVSLDGVNEVAEVSLEGASKSGDNLSCKSNLRISSRIFVLTIFPMQIKKYENGRKRQLVAAYVHDLL